MRKPLLGMGSLRKPIMFRDSRKAQLNSYAHHRASMLFTFKDPPEVTGDTPHRTRLTAFPQPQGSSLASRPYIDSRDCLTLTSSPAGWYATQSYPTPELRHGGQP